MREEPLFKGPLERPFFLQASAPLPIGGQKTTGALKISIGPLLATGITSSVLALSGGATVSRGNVRIGVSVATAGLNRGMGNDLGATQTDEPSESAAWMGYLNDLNSVLPGPFSRKVRKFWSDLSRISCPVPHASPTPQGSFILVWDRERHHFEVEVFPGGRFEWFYCDRLSDYYEGAEGNRDHAVRATANFLEKLSMA